MVGGENVGVDDSVTVGDSVNDAEGTRLSTGVCVVVLGTGVVGDMVVED